MNENNWLEVLGWGEKELSDLRSIAYSYIRQGIYDVALQVFDGLAVLGSPSAYDLQTLGALHLQLGNGIKALDYLERALKIDPSHLPTQLNLAKTLLQLGYRRQGLLQASSLKQCALKPIAEQAEALLLSYSEKGT